MTSLTGFFPLAAPAWRFQHEGRTMEKTGEQRLCHMVENYGNFIARTLRNLGVSSAELDDCAQKVFIIAARRITDIENGKEKAFLFRCAQNTAAHYRRSLARKREVSDENLVESFDPELQPDVISQRRRYRRLLDDILSKMEEPLRAILILHAFEEMTMAEISTMLDIPAGTVASRLRRARTVFKHEVLAIEAAEREEIA